MTEKIETPGIPLPPKIKNDLTRRDFLTAGAAAMLLGGCGSGEESGEESGEGNTSSNTRAVEHKYGSTEVPESPGRVVTVGLSDHDAVLALGVVPVGVVEWYGEYPSATWPWAEDELGGEEPEVLLLSDTNSQPNFEVVAALEPDLIIGQYTGMSEDQFGTLSEIAPTVAQSGEFPDFAMPWQETTRRIGLALGRAEQADELVSEVEARFEEARRAHPEFKGMTGLLAQGWDGEYNVLSSSSPRGEFLTSLGFETPEEVAGLFEEGGKEFVSISEERLDLLDADVLLWPSSPGLEETLEENELYQSLDVASEGRDIFLSGEALSGALQWSTVLSLPIALERLVPMLAAAVDGDPETEAPS